MIAGQAAWQHHDVIANGVRLHYVEAGSREAPLVLLLHGFPDGWYTWRHQIGPLADAGFRVVAPDLRGYGQSEKPHGVAAYCVETLVADVAELIDVLTGGGRAAAVIGHDWGGGITWAIATVHADRVERIAVLNCPPAAALLRAFSQHPQQALRSWYIAFFQIPALPELVLRASGLRFVDAAYAPARLRNPDGVTAQDAAYVRRELSRPGALTAAINYYRALGWRSPAATRRFLRPVRVPSLVIWGEQDPYLASHLLELAQPWATDLKVARLPTAGHFCHQECPGRVNELLVDWLHST